MSNMGHGITSSTGASRLGGVVTPSLAVCGPLEPVPVRAFVAHHLAAEHDVELLRLHRGQVVGVRGRQGRLASAVRAAAVVLGTQKHVRRVDVGLDRVEQQQHRIPCGLGESGCDL